MAPTLNDYEYMLDDDGVLLNAESAGVTAVLPWIDVNKISGLDSPEFRTAQRDHEGVDGGYIDSEFMSMRTVVLEGTIYADPADADTLCDALRYNYRPTSETRPFYFKHPNKPPRVVFGKAQGARYDVEQLRRWGSTAVQLTIVCPTPYIYDADEIVGIGDLGGQDTGHGFNHGFDYGFGGNNNYDGSVAVFNAGNHVAYPTVIINGPISQPALIESSTGKRVAFDVSLSNVDWLEVDFRRHRVTLNGVFSKRSSLLTGPRSWWSIPPGTSSIKLTGTQGSGTGSAIAVADSATADYIEVTDADAGDVVVGDRVHLYDTSNVMKETTLFTVTSKTILGTGNTQIFFTPSAATVPLTTDKVIAGNATFQVSMRSTYY
jgi:hypothetical protein